MRKRIINWKPSASFIPAGLSVSRSINNVAKGARESSFFLDFFDGKCYT